MNLTREEWQADLREKIKIVLPKLKQAGVTSGYAIIATAAILPVALAGNLWFPALATMVGGIGANLISNMVQGTKDEFDLAKRLQNLPADDQVHGYVRQLLEKLEALNTIRQALPESDWIRLEILLDQKLAGLKLQQPCLILNLPTISSLVTSTRAREITRQWLGKNWWVERKPVKPLSPRSENLTIVLYSASVRVNYSTNVTKPKHERKGSVFFETKVVSTPPKAISLIYCPSYLTNCSSTGNELCNVINGFSPKNKIEFGHDWLNKLYNQYQQLGASLSYYLKVLFYELNSGIGEPSKIAWPNINRAEKRILHIADAIKSKREVYKVSIPEKLEEKVIGQARAIFEEKINFQITDSMRSVQYVSSEYLYESIKFLPYPLWIMDTETIRPVQVIIDALSGYKSYI